jgi:DNA-binding transcriptional ArsR family regulator
MYRVEVDWAPAWELLASLNAFRGGADQKVMDLGPAWAREVGRRVDPRLPALIAPLEKKRHGGVFDLLVWQCPGDRDPESFLRWLCSLSLGELYELLAPHAPEEPAALPRDLTAWRDRFAEVLAIWNEQYFSQVDPAILRALRADAEAKRSLIGSMPAEELVEAATHGVRYVPEPSPDVVLLIPQWHFRPWNTFGSFRRMRMIKYPVDALPAAPGEPPVDLLRLTRVLSDESRLRILHWVAAAPRTFTDLVGLTGLSKSTVNHHMMTLRAAGLVRVIETGDPGKEKNRRTYELRADALDGLSGRLRAYLTEE